MDMPDSWWVAADQAPSGVSSPYRVLPWPFLFFDAFPTKQVQKSAPHTNTFVNITYGSFFPLEVKFPFSEMHKSCLTDSERCIQLSISDHRKVWSILSLAVASLSCTFPVCRYAPTTIDTLPIRKFCVGAVLGLHPRSGHPLSTVLSLPGAVSPLWSFIAN